MSAPIINDRHPPTWVGQLRALLAQHKAFATRVDALDALMRMARLAELHGANHPTIADAHASATELLRVALEAHRAGGKMSYGRLEHIANLADQAEQQMAMTNIAPLPKGITPFTEKW